MTRPLAILAGLSSLGFSQEKITYDDHVFPIFQQSCLNCHNPDKAKGGLDLSSFSATLKGGSGGKIVEPGDVSSSLVRVVMQTAEPKMPPEGDKLASANIDILRKWIEGGLLENKTSSARKASKPKFATALSSDPAAKPDGPPPLPEHVLLEPPVLTSRPAAIHALAAAPWAPLLAVTGQRQILLHNSENLELVGILPFPEGDPVSLAFSPDSRYLIVGGGIPGKSGVTVTFDVTNGSRLLSAGKEFDAILAADIRPGFDIVATGGPSKLLKIWKTDTGELVKSVKKHTDWITALDLSPDGVLLASGDRNGGVWVWESESASEFHTLRAHQAAITAAVFRADSNILATASEDGTVRFWEMNGGGEVKKLDAHAGGVTAFAFARDGSSITAGRDMKAKLWKPDFNHARDLIQDLPALPTAVALDAEGKRAFVADAQGTIRVFQTEDGKAVGEILANPPAIEARLQHLAAEISRQEQVLATTEKTAAETSATRDQAHLALAEAEKARQQAAEIQKAAEAGAAQAPGDQAAAKIAADALARVQSTEQALAPHRSAVEAADKAAADSTAAIAAARTPLDGLRSAVKRWSAAAINTRALSTLREAGESTVALEESQQIFIESAGSIAARADALNAKRQEREKLAGSCPEDRPPELDAELKATLAAVDIRISQALDALSAAENDTLARRDTLEQSSPETFRKVSESESLRQAYLDALK